MSNYFKMMFNATLSCRKNNKTEIIEEFLGFNSTPKVVPPSTPQIPKPMMQQPMPMYPQMYNPMPMPMPMYPPVQYPYFGMNNKKNNKDSSDDDSGILKMLLAAGLLGGGGALAYNLMPKKKEHPTSDKLDKILDIAGNSPQTISNILGQLREFGVNHRFIASPPSLSSNGKVISGGLELSDDASEKFIKRHNKEHNDSVAKNWMSAIDASPSFAKPWVSKLAARVSNLPQEYTAKFGNQVNNSTNNETSKK